MSRPLRPLPAALPFSVDTWGPAVAAKAQFLSHAHKDHMDGLHDTRGTALFATPTTAALLPIKRPCLAPRLAPGGGVAVTALTDPGDSALGDTLQLTAPRGDGGYPYTVTPLFTANHCPGAAMLLFESEVWGSVLHTGDCRVGPGELAALVEALEERLGPGGRPGLVYLDATAGEGAGILEFPPIESADAIVVDAVLRSAATHTVLLSMERLGGEGLIRRLHESTGLRIYLPRRCWAPGAAHVVLGRPPLLSGEAGCGCCFTTEALHREFIAQAELLGIAHCFTDDPAATPLRLIGGEAIPWLRDAIDGRRPPCAAGSGGGERGGAGPRVDPGLLRRPVLIVRPSMMRAWLEEAQEMEDAGAPRAALRARRAAPVNMPLRHEGCLLSVLRVQHSSLAELRALVQALRPERLVAFAGSLAPLRDAIPAGTLVPGAEELESHYRGCVARWRAGAAALLQEQARGEEQRGGARRRAGATGGEDAERRTSAEGQQQEAEQQQQQQQQEQQGGTDRTAQQGRSPLQPSLAPLQPSALSSGSAGSGAALGRARSTPAKRVAPAAGPAAPQPPPPKLGGGAAAPGGVRRAGSCPTAFPGGGWGWAPVPPPLKSGALRGARKVVAAAEGGDAPPGSAPPGLAPAPCRSCGEAGGRDGAAGASQREGCGGLGAGTLASCPASLGGKLAGEVLLQGSRSAESAPGPGSAGSLCSTTSLGGGAGGAAAGAAAAAAAAAAPLEAGAAPRKAAALFPPSAAPAAAAAPIAAASSSGPAPLSVHSHHPATTAPMQQQRGEQEPAQPVAPAPEASARSAAVDGGGSGGGSGVGGSLSQQASSAAAAPAVGSLLSAADRRRVLAAAAAAARARTRAVDYVLQRCAGSMGGGPLGG
ncbi:MAG: hypothetical protein J3K34DRAFT_460880 [Monoraphidium minutum]|nr:MAG: hypothetical protein J3K34DRAFT_460880 [Monoraphidium minutum]